METDPQKKIDRQAVVIIHGMGEQRPMDTLRDFVKGITFWIKNGDNSRYTKPYYWSRPDAASEMYETRLITMQSYKDNPKTDFYEFYWAQHMRDTSLSHMIPWLKKLLFTRRKKVPPRLQTVQTLVRILLVLLAIVIGVVIWKWNDMMEFPLWTAGVVLGITAVIRFLLPWIKTTFVDLITTTAGDAARYFNPMPSNIEERSSIRREGINFLRKLHNRTSKPYDRIIVVGHSLGSVVAYDIVRLLWHEMHEEFKPRKEPDEACFKEMDAFSKLADDPNYVMSPEKLIEFQELQNRCWNQYRTNGNRWLISDFITCAGAVAHADFFLINKPDFSEFIKHKELPASPPVIEGDDKSVLHYPDKKEYEWDKDATGKSKMKDITPLNHAALFAVTRWTNIYFTSDYVGSSARRIFREGIKDIEVKRKGFILLPGGHTNYWDAVPDNEALHQLAVALGFNKV